MRMIASISSSPTLSRSAPFLYASVASDTSVCIRANISQMRSSPADNPLLDVTPQSLNFGATSTVGEFTARNTGGGSLQVTAVTWSENWLNIVAENAAELSIMSRNGLPAPVR